jgi:hypothetical protein
MEEQEDSLYDVQGDVRSIEGHERHCLDFWRQHREQRWISPIRSTRNSDDSPEQKRREVEVGVGCNGGIEDGEKDGIVPKESVDGQAWDKDLLVRAYS